MFSRERPRYFRRNASDARFDRIRVVRRHRAELETGSLRLAGQHRGCHGPLVPASRFAPNRADVDVIVPDDDPNHRADDPVAASGLDDDLPCLFYLLKLLCGQRHCSRLRAGPHAGRRTRRLDQVEPVFGSEAEQPRSGSQSGGAGLRRPSPLPPSTWSGARRERRGGRAGQDRRTTTPGGRRQMRRQGHIWTQLSTPWTLSTQVG